MRVSGLTVDGDWRFGKGKATYKRRSDAIRQNVFTRLRSFENDWFLDITHGLPWVDMLGSRNTRQRILREIERQVLTTEGVRAIDRLELVSVDDNRAATIQIAIIDIFDERYDETVRIRL